MSGSPAALTDALDRERLNADSIRFADSSLAFGRALAAGSQSGSASPQMLDALARWRRDVRRTQARVTRLPHHVAERDLALRALKKLGQALGDLANGLAGGGREQPQAAFARALHLLSEYHKLGERLDRSLR